MALNVLYARCAGLDVHKVTVVACLLLTTASGKVSRQVRTFAATTLGLQELANWLASFGVTHVAMESTGIYWRPVFNLLEGRFEVILVNAQHIGGDRRELDVGGLQHLLHARDGLGTLLHHRLARTYQVAQIADGFGGDEAGGEQTVA